MRKLIIRAKIDLRSDTSKKRAIWRLLLKQGYRLQKHFPHIIIFGYAFLFMYTGSDKLKNVEAFINGNMNIPYLGMHAEIISWSVPILECLLAMLLILPFIKLKRIALQISVYLMGVFTLYLGLMIFFVKENLCHCGGVLESMGWIPHLIFNLAWLGAGIFALIKLNTKT